MKRVRYTKYNGDLASEMDLEGLLQALSDYLLDSGFRDPYARFRSSITTSTICARRCGAFSKAGDFFDEDDAAEARPDVRRGQAG